jgi:hypothetical protein
MLKEYSAPGFNLQLNKFNMTSLIYNDDGKFLNPKIALIAKSGGGKSWLIREIVYYLRDIPCAVAICPTDKITGFYNEFIPQCFTHHEYTEAILSNIMKRQQKYLIKNKEREKKGKSIKDNRIIFIMDDCMSTRHLWLKDPKMLSLFFEGRHYGISYILSMQFSLGIPPELRAQFDFVFLLGEDMFHNKRRLYEHYAGMFPTRDIFDQVFSQITENYGCMVINNRIKTSDLTKKVFWYKSQPTPKFTLGNNIYLKWNNENYDENYNNREKVLDLNSFYTKRRTNIQVKLI